MSRFIVLLSTTVLLGILTSTCLDAAPQAGGMNPQTDGAACSAREWWRVLFGAGAGVMALLVSLHAWECCFVQSSGENWADNILFKLVLVLIRVLSPQLCTAPKAVTAGYAAIMMRHRLKTMSPTISKRFCPMVIWLGIDEDTYASFFGQRGLTSDGETRNMAVIKDTATTVIDMEGHTSEQVQSNIAGDYDGMEPVIADDEKVTVQEYFKHAHRLRRAPAPEIALPWPGSKLPPAGEEEQPYFICLQGWDRKTIMWKEVMVSKGVLGSEQNMSKWMGMLKVMPWWARALVVVLGLGYEASILSRFVHHLGVSPLELIGSWIWLVLLVEAGIVPLFVVPSYQGIHLHLDCTQFREVVQEYIKRTDEQTHLPLNCINLWSFVFCILYILVLFLIVNPPLVYYYYKLPSSILSFISLILFAVLAGAGIITFALMLFYPPHHVVLAFSHLWKPPSSLFKCVVTILLLLSGLSSYILAVIDTTRNWALFQAQDHSFFSFMMPHVGS